MNFSGVSRKSFAGRALRCCLRVVPPGLVLPIMQGPNRGMKWVVGASDHGCWLGSYEHDRSRLLASMLRPQMVIFDIGANVGYYTLLAARCAKHVFAFEPLPENLVYLERHNKLNRLANVTVLPLAVSRANGDARFVKTGSRLMGHLAPSGEICVRTARLDSLELPAPDLIKMDIENSEYDALFGARSMLLNRKPTILLSTHWWEIRDKCLALLTDFGYSIRELAVDEYLCTDGGREV